MSEYEELLENLRDYKGQGCDASGAVDAIESLLERLRTRPVIDWVLFSERPPPKTDHGLEDYLVWDNLLKHVTIGYWSGEGDKWEDLGYTYWAQKPAGPVLPAEPPTVHPPTEDTGAEAEESADYADDIPF